MRKPAVLLKSTADHCSVKLREESARKKKQLIVIITQVDFTFVTSYTYMGADRVFQYESAMMDLPVDNVTLTRVLFIHTRNKIAGGYLLENSSGCSYEANKVRI